MTMCQRTFVPVGRYKGRKTKYLHQIVFSKITFFLSPCIPHPPSSDTHQHHTFLKIGSGSTFLIYICTNDNNNLEASEQIIITF